MLLVRLLLLAVLALVLAVGWLMTGVAGMTTADSACIGSAPSDVGSTRQEVEWWPPRLTCVHTTSAGVVRDRQDDELRMRLAGVVVTGLGAVGVWAVAALYVFRRA